MLILSEHDAARLGIVGAKKRKPAKAAREARPDIPRAPQGEGDRIAQLIRIADHHFSPRYRAGLGFDFWHVDGRSTTLCQDYAQACVTAEGELKNG